MVLPADFDFEYTAVITFAGGFDNIRCFDDDENNIFFNGGGGGGDTFFFGEGDVVATVFTDGFEGGTCFGDDNNIFFGKGCDIFGEGGDVDGGMIENPS